MLVTWWVVREGWAVCGEWASSLRRQRVAREVVGRRSESLLRLCRPLLDKMNKTGIKVTVLVHSCEAGRERSEKVTHLCLWIVAQSESLSRSGSEGVDEGKGQAILCIELTTDVR